MKRLVLVAALLLAGCGAREALKPAADAALPTKPYAATATPGADALLAAPIQTRPARSDDLIQSSDKRRSDQFDLPPR
jgi:uncharacterized lipoprotein YmbA